MTERGAAPEPGAGPGSGFAVAGARADHAKDRGRKDPARVPGHGAVTIGTPRPRIVAVMLAFMAFYTWWVVLGFSIGEGGLVIFGLLLLLITAPGCANVLRTRFVLDGARLHSRNIMGWSAVVDLDGLVGVGLTRLSDADMPRRLRWRVLRLEDSTGVAVTLNITAGRGEPLLREIAARLDRGTIAVALDTATRETLVRARDRAPRRRRGTR